MFIYKVKKWLGKTKFKTEMCTWDSKLASSYKGDRQILRKIFKHKPFKLFITFH